MGIVYYNFCDFLWFWFYKTFKDETEKIMQYFNEYLKELWEILSSLRPYEVIYKFVYNYKGKIIEGTCIAKKGVVKLSDAWVKTIGLW